MLGAKANNEQRGSPACLGTTYGAPPPLPGLPQLPEQLCCAGGLGIPSFQAVCSPFPWVIPALGVQDPAACLSFPGAHVCQRVLTCPETCQCTALVGVSARGREGQMVLPPEMWHCGAGGHLEGWVGWGGIADPPWERCKRQNFGIG